MREKIFYGPAAYQEADRKIIGRHIQARREAQVWQFSETGHMGRDEYRIDVRVDHSYPTQGGAKLSLWGVGGWNEYVKMYGDELPAYFEGVNRFRQEGTAEMFDLVSEDLLREAAKLKFSR